MKKLILFLLLSFSLQAQTYSEISDLIDNNLSSGTKITAIKHREVEHALLDFIQNNLFQTGDIKVIKCDATYLSNNFEADGLGKNLRLGWALCNGNNGTDNLTGRVGIGYGLGYSTIGAIGGEKEHTLTIDEMPAHTHNAPADGGSTNSSGSNFRRESDNTGNLQTASAGGGLPHNNMQPYIVQVYIMKL